MLGFVKDNLVSLLTELPLEKGKQKAEAGQLTFPPWNPAPA